MTIYTIDQRGQQEETFIKNEITVWAINRLCLQKQWEIKESPLEMTYKPTGQKIYFRGLDDPLKVTSITVEHGYLCWMWREEVYGFLLGSSRSGDE